MGRRTWASGAKARNMLAGVGYSLPVRSFIDIPLIVLRCRNAVVELSVDLGDVEKKIGIAGHGVAMSQEFHRSLEVTCLVLLPGRCEQLFCIELWTRAGAIASRILW
jgi:hypothetical protein